MKANFKVKSDSRYGFRRNFMSTVPVVDFDRSGVLNGDTGCFNFKVSGDEIGISSYTGSIQKTFQVSYQLHHIDHYYLPNCFPIFLSGPGDCD